MAAGDHASSVIHGLGWHESAPALRCESHVMDAIANQGHLAGCLGSGDAYGRQSRAQRRCWLQKEYSQRMLRMVFCPILLHSL